MKIELQHEQSQLINTTRNEWNWYSARRRWHNLWVDFEGTGILKVNQQSFAVTPGFAILLKPSDTVRGLNKGQGPLCNMGMHFVYIEHNDSSRLSPFCSRPVQLRHFSVLREMSRYLDVLLFQSTDEPREASNRIAEDILSIFCRDLKLGPEDPVDIRVSAQAELMRAQPETSWNVQTLAEEAGLSASQFSRRFRKLFHCSPHHFLIQQRIEKARTLLMESQLTVSEIADTLGYADLGFFSRQFKQKTGCTPLNMRRG